MAQIDRSITPERYAEGYTFPDWLDYIGSAENLARASSAGRFPTIQHQDAAVAAMLRRTALIGRSACVVAEG